MGGFFDKVVEQEKLIAQLVTSVASSSGEARYRAIENLKNAQEGLAAIHQAWYWSTKRERE
jgi:hypothetical protein